MEDPKPDPLAQYAHVLPPSLQQTPSFELKPRSKGRGGAIGIGAVLLALALKFKTALLLLLNFKWVAIGAKFALSFGSLLLNMWAWSLLFGWPFAVGFVLLIFVHEMGHFIAARLYGLPVSLPIFIPFIGAAVSIKNLPRDSTTSAVISLAGPFVGGLGALGCYVAGVQTGSPFWYALASTMFFINLINLVPMVPFDGGWVAYALWSRASQMPTSAKWVAGAAYFGLAAGLFALWQIAAHQVVMTPR